MKKTLAVIGLAAATLAGAHAQIAFNIGTYSEDFNSMPSTGNATYPTAWSGWKVSGTGTLPASSVITSATSPAFTTDNGTGTSGTVYNYGLNAGSNRSLGSISSGTTVPAFGVSLTNNSGITLTASDLTMGFTARQWRTGSSSTANETWAFSYKIGGNLTDLTGWTSLASFNINEILTTSTVAGPVDGLASGNFTVLSPQTFTGLTWNAAEVLHLRWVDSNDTGTDAGMAIDDFSLTAVPEPQVFALIGLAGLAWVVFRKRRAASA